MTPLQMFLPSQNRATHATTQRSMATGMALSVVVHLSLLIGISFWEERVQPPVIHAVTLVSPSTVVLPPSMTTKTSSPHPVPPPSVAAPASEDDPNRLQAWWEKKAKSLKKQIQQAKRTPRLPPSKVENPAVGPVQNVAVSTPAPAATPVSAQQTPVVHASSNAILQTGVPDTDRALLENPSYFSRVQDKIDRLWVATWSRSGGAAATILFRIQKNGTIRDVQIEQPSGDWLFDQAALRAIHEANPLPPLPPGLTTQVVHYRFVSQPEKRP